MALTDQDRKRLRAAVDQPEQGRLSAMERGRLRAVRRSMNLPPEDRDLLDTALAVRPPAGGAA